MDRDITTSARCMEHDSSRVDKLNDLASRIAALSQEQRTLLARSLSRQLADGHTLVAQSLQTTWHHACVLRVWYAHPRNFRQMRGIGDSPDRGSSSTGWSDDGDRAKLYNWEAQRCFYSFGRTRGDECCYGHLDRQRQLLAAYRVRRPKAAEYEGMGSFQELDAVPMYKSITKWSAW